MCTVVRQARVALRTAEPPNRAAPGASPRRCRDESVLALGLASGRTRLRRTTVYIDEAPGAMGTDRSVVVPAPRLVRGIGNCEALEPTKRSGVTVGASARGEGPERTVNPSTFSLSPSREGRGLGRFTATTRLAVRKFPQIATSAQGGAQGGTSHALSSRGAGTEWTGRLDFHSGASSPAPNLSAGTCAVSVRAPPE